MKFKIKVMSAIALIFGLQWLSVYAQETGLEQPTSTKPSQETALQAIVSTNGEKRLKAAIQLDRERDQLIKRLISVLNSTNPVVEKIEAVIVLGEYRAKESVPILVDHLDWEDAAPGDSSVHGPMTREASDRKSSMAVTSALIKIGMPAIPALVDKILKTNNDRIKKKCVLCCAVIEGLHMTRMRFEDRIKNEVDQAKKQKFESALQILNNFKVLKDGSIFMDWF